MTLTPNQFQEFFQATHNQQLPFPWQSRLVSELAKGEWPDCIDLPTASGKTSVIDISLFTLACQAELPPAQRTMARRIFFTVNRRVIVDEAYERAIRLAQMLKQATHGILKQVADALRKIGGDTEMPLDVAQLRGGVYHDSAWARSITQPIIVCTTADQLGSRLLFRGYGVSPRMQPVHAALCACDSLVLLDEAHITRAFSQTLRLIQKYQQHSPGLRFVEMTATPSVEPKRRFSLCDDDITHPVLSKRLNARKPTDLVKVRQKDLVTKLVERSLKAQDKKLNAIGIIVNRVQTARDVYAKLLESHPDRMVHLVIGRMRPLDRDDLQAQLRQIVGPERPEQLKSPVFIVATQCLEVGADYDFDALITECASIDALRQRFGRLNRRGRDIPAIATIMTTDVAIKNEDPVYGEALKYTWDWLTKDNRSVIDFGVSAFSDLWQKVDDQTRQRMICFSPDAAVLLPAHLDVLCQTNPQPKPTPDVSYFIHGPQRDNAELNVCWRADLGDNPQIWGNIVSLLPPTSPECMSVPLRTVRQWMNNDESIDDADVPIHEETAERDKPGTQTTRQVLCWRGADDAILVDDPNVLRPGDTIVIPASDTASDTLGHFPKPDGKILFDRAEESFALARRQRVVRVHPAIHPELVQSFKDYLDARELLGKPAIRKCLGDLAAGFTTGPAVVTYPGDPSLGVVFRFVPTSAWKRDKPTDDGGEDASSDSTSVVVLSKHVADVVRCVQSAVACLEIGSYAPLFDIAAKHHDDGKADIRFTAMLAGVSPYEVLGRPPLAKSGERGLTTMEQHQRRTLALLPDHFRHEMLSTQILEQAFDKLITDASIDRDLLLHLVAAHHGYARPFAPVCIDQPTDKDLLSLEFNGHIVTANQRHTWTPAHRIDSGVAERFWNLTRQHGWWGLAYLETILRLADQQASAIEQAELI